MSKLLVRIFATIGTLLLLYLGVVLVGSILQLADAADRVHAGLGQAVFWVLMAAFLGLFITPFALYFKLPKALELPLQCEGAAYHHYMSELRERLSGNPRLLGVPLASEDDVKKALSILAAEADKIIRDTANAVFIGTAVMQNGRLDGLISLTTQMRMVWLIASLYQQRPSPRQMFQLYSNVGAATLVAQNIEDVDFSELVTPIVVSIIPSLKGAVPGLQGISSLLVNSLSSGAANALLTLRVGYIARQYCEALSVPSMQDVRKSATAQALPVLSSITRENGLKIVTGTWGVIKGVAGDAISASVQGVVNTAEKVSDSAKSGAKVVGGLAGTAAQGVKDGAAKAADSMVAGTKSIGGAIGGAFQVIKVMTDKEIK